MDQCEARPMGQGLMDQCEARPMGQGLMGQCEAGPFVRRPMQKAIHCYKSKTDRIQINKKDTIKSKGY
jgi:hypothetical protein